MKPSLVIGSRGSKLALWQANYIKDRLFEFHPDLQIQVEVIKTTGDIKPDPLSVIGGQGVFTKELEESLLNEKIDLAVHSLKDLPTILPDRLVIAAICEREDPRDALVLAAGSELRCESLKDLPEKSVVGTSSQRRVAQLKSVRRNVVVEDVRGNVDTRLRKLDEGRYDALILAAAGLTRLGLQDRISTYIPVAEILPAVGQGALGLETRAADQRTKDIVAPLNHVETALACTAERALLRSLGGGCQLPIAAHATINGPLLILAGMVATPDGMRIVREQIVGSPGRAEELGRDLSLLLNAQGAYSILHSSQ
jgi:hydroxymethylbilane synthase